jgi:peptidylprolyl isomerase/peptidyl-prolyl cis-trans isomerase B (cyclophilin B)
MKTTLRGLLAVCSLLAVLPASAQQALTPDALCAAAVPATDPETRAFTEAENVLQPGTDYRAILCTGAGAVYVDLLEQAAPATVNNFVFLADNGYYNNTTFHRVIADFMAQGGDPTATGSGGPGYQFGDEFAGFLNFDRPGWLAMANAGADTNGSQFFLTTAETPHLDYKHAIFGEVLEGQSVVENIALRDPQTATTPGTSLDTVLIITDPASVQTTYTAPAPPQRADFESALSLLQAGVSDPLAMVESGTGILDLDQTVALAPADEQPALREALTSAGFQYHVAVSVNNAGCQLDGFPIAAFSYQLDVLADDAAARAFADDALWSAVLTGEAGPTPTFGYPIVTQEVTACDQPMVQAQTHWQRGPMVASVSVTFIASPGLDAEELLYNFAGVNFERIFQTPLRAGIRTR